MLIHVVDDETTVRLLVAYLLRSIGHTVETHASSDALFGRLKKVGADLIITDFIMPQTDGLELCRRVRAEPSTAAVPIIVMTGLELPPSVAESMRTGLGVTEIVIKPFSAEALLAAVKRAMQIPVPKHVAESFDAENETRLRHAVRAVGQRLQPRIEAKIALNISWDSETIDATSEDVSINGLFVVSERAPPIMAEVIVSVVSRDGKTPLSMRASVVHVRPLANGHFGFGLSLQETRVQIFYAWYQLIAKLYRRDRVKDPASGRTATRAPLMGEVRVEHGNATSVHCTVGDISAGGMRVFGGSELPRDVTLHFSLPTDAQPRCADARVRWMSRQAPGRLAYGLAFASADPAMAQAIEAYVQGAAAH